MPEAKSMTRHMWWRVDRQQSLAAWSWLAEAICWQFDRFARKFHVHGP